jgi:ABC-2 type transport system permease protein
MLKVAHLTPHAWAADGFASLVRHDGTLVDVLPELGVLLVFATVLFALGAWVLRRLIVHA